MDGATGATEVVIAGTGAIDRIEAAAVAAGSGVVVRAAVSPADRAVDPAADQGGAAILPNDSNR